MISQPEDRKDYWQHQGITSFAEQFPNNFFLTPFSPCDGCAPGLVSETD